MSHATCLLALPEFEVVAVWTFVDEAIVHVVMPRTEVACTRCGVIGMHRVHDRVVHRVRDLPVAGRAVVLLWRKRVLVCLEGCGTFRERARAIAPRACLTVRARAEAVRLISGENRSVAAVAATFGVSWDTVMRAVRDDAAQVLEAHEGQRVVAFGLDETVMNPARSHTRRRYVTVFVDLDRHRGIDVVEGRHAAAVTGWLETQDPVRRAQVATVALDPHAGYRTAVTDPTSGSTTPSWSRTASTWSSWPTPSSTMSAVGCSRRPSGTVVTSTIRSTGSAVRCWPASNGSTPRPSSTSAPHWPPATPTTRPGNGQEMVRGIFATRDPDVAARRLVAFYEWVADVEVPELVRLATTLARWQDEILAYHDTGGVSSARVEAINLDVKNIKRVARGFTNFDNYRARILSRLGQTRQAPTTARLQGPNALTLAA